MKKLLGTALLAAASLFLLMGSARQGADANAILDKAVTALGGADKLGKIKTMTWKYTGTMSFGGNDNPVSTTVTVQGLDHLRQETEGEFGGNTIHVVRVLAGDKGWLAFNDMKMPTDNIANEKRTVYLTVVPMTVLPLKDKDFKVEVQPEEKIGDKPVNTLKVTAKDGKDFTISFDKDTGLPVRTVAKVLGFQGDEFTQETTFSNYKEKAGIQVATKVSSKRNGEKFIDEDVSSFTTSDKEADAKTFAEPD